MFLRIQWCEEFSRDFWGLKMISADWDSIVVVSNRLPFVVRHQEAKSNYVIESAGGGGLVTSILPLLESRPLSSAWVGWPGIVDLPKDEEGPVTRFMNSTQSFRTAPVFLSSLEFDLYYNGACLICKREAYHLRL